MWSTIFCEFNTFFQIVLAEILFYEPGWWHSWRKFWLPVNNQRKLFRLQDWSFDMTTAVDSNEVETLLLTHLMIWCLMQKLVENCIYGYSLSLSTLDGLKVWNLHLCLGCSTLHSSITNLSFLLLIARHLLLAPCFRVEVSWSYCQYWLPVIII